MPYKFFTVPIQDDGSGEGVLNAFLRSHKVLSVDLRWVEQGAASFWSFCVDFMDAVPGHNSSSRDGPARNKIDYREVLKPEDFTVFARLRDLRKEIAQAEGVPVYTVFTNEQLAQMVQNRVTSKAALEKIAGVGDARIEKYGPRVLEMLKGVWKSNNEAGRSSV
jgi:superfamily II DNA helicase RecQ